MSEVNLVLSLLQAIVNIDGEALVMHAGDKPYVVSPSGQVELASRGLTLDAVCGIVSQLLPVEFQHALDEFGAVQYTLPPRPEFPQEQFTVVVARGGDDVWAEIRRKRVLDDRVVEELLAEPVSAPASATAVIDMMNDDDFVEIEVPGSAQAVDEGLALPGSAHFWPGAPGYGADVAGDEQEVIELTLPHEEPVIEQAPDEGTGPVAPPIPQAPLAPQEPLAPSTPPLAVEPPPAAVEEPPLPALVAPPPVPAEHAAAPRTPAAPPASPWAPVEPTAPSVSPAVMSDRVGPAPLAPPPPPAAVAPPPAIPSAPVELVAPSAPLAVMFDLVGPAPHAPPLPPAVVAPPPPAAVAPPPPAAVAPLPAAPTEPAVTPTLVAPPLSPSAPVEPVAPSVPPSVTFHPVISAPPAPPRPEPVRPPAPRLAPPPAVVLPMSRHPIRIETPPPSVRVGDTLSGLERLLRTASTRGASALYLSSDARPSVRVDGGLQSLDGEPVHTANDVISLLLTLMPDRSHEALRTGTTTEWICDIEDIGRVRCMSFSDHRGPGGVFRLMPVRSVSVDHLGLGREIQSLAIEPEGLVVIAGLRSSGKRTLISALVDLINRTRHDHVITIEREVNIVHDGRSSFVSQREVRGGDDEVLAAARAALREDPDVLVLEQIGTGPLMSVALEAAALGHLVIGGFSAHNATEAIDRILDFYAPEHSRQVQLALADNLRGVVAQVLLPKTGGGRVAAREVLLNTPAVAGVIAEGKTSQLPMAIEGGRRLGMVPLDDALVSHVQSGIVDIRDAYRHATDRPAFLALLERQGVDTSAVERLA